MDELTSNMKAHESLKSSRVMARAKGVGVNVSG